MSESFGIYIKTFKADHHLAKVLIASIAHFNPGSEITLIPDDGYSDPTLWGYNVLNTADPFLQSLKGYYKKFWALYGPYDRFVYTDADAMLLKPLTALIGRVECTPRPFLIGNVESKDADRWANSADAERMYGNVLGNLDLMEQFDPQYEFRRAIPAPSGFFASSRNAIPLDLLVDTMRRLDAFHKQMKLPPLTDPAGQRWGVFNADQGVLNYIVMKAGVKLELMRDVFLWGARPIPMAAAGNDNALSNLFIHWAGCPRPNFTRRNVPGGDQWIRFYYQYYRNRPRLEFLKDTARNVLDDAYSRVRAPLSRLKRRILSRRGRS